MLTASHRFSQQPLPTDAEPSEDPVVVAEEVMRRASLGELSKAVHLLSSPGLAPCTDATVQALRACLVDERRGPAPAPAALAQASDPNHVLDERLFCKALRTASRGGA